MSNGKKKTAPTQIPTGLSDMAGPITGSSSPKTKTTYYKRGKYKGEVKKVKTYTTGPSGDITKSKIKYTKTGDVKKEKIKTSKKGVLGILGAKRKAKYTKKSGVTVSQVKGKVDPKKIAKTALKTGVIGVMGAGWGHGTLSAIEASSKIFGTKTVAGLAGTAAASTLSSIAMGPLAFDTLKEERLTDSTGSFRTSVKGKVTKGRRVQSEWAKMGA